MESINNHSCVDHKTIAYGFLRCHATQKTLFPLSSVSQQPDGESSFFKQQTGKDRCHAVNTPWIRSFVLVIPLAQSFHVDHCVPPREHRVKVFEVRSCLTGVKNANSMTIFDIIIFGFSFETPMKRRSKPR